METKWLNDIGKFAQRNSPAILSGVAIAGVIGTAILAVKATPRAAREIEIKIYNKAHEEERAVTIDDKLPPIEVIKATWKFYIPTGLSAIATIACIAGANKIGAQRNAALVAAYTLVDRSFSEYKDKVLEEIGAKPEAEIREKVAQDRIEKAGPVSKEVILATGSDQLCYEMYTGRYFRSEIEKIRRAENDINQRMLAGDMCASFNEWSDAIGLDHAEVGDEVGFNVDNRVECVFSSHLNPDGIPCLAIGYVSNPRPDYSKCF